MTLQRIKVAKGTDGAIAVHPTVSDAGPAGGFTPGDLASAYSVDPNTADAGQVVGIVDAHDNPDALTDLNAFDAQYGLPAETASSFQKIGQDGGAPPTNTTPPTDEEVGWAGEIALDLEAVRGICHTCRIVLVESNTSNFEDLAVGVNTAVSHGATVVSNSYGGAEGSDPGGPDDETDPAVQAAFNHPGVVITASTGDDGYYDYDNFFNGDPSDNAPSAPASFPGVVATAGTTLQLNDDGTRAAEVSWNSNGQAGLTARFRGESLFASGGGCSTEFARAGLAARDEGLGADRLRRQAAHRRRRCAGRPADRLRHLRHLLGQRPAHPWGTFGGTSLSSPADRRDVRDGRRRARRRPAGADPLRPPEVRPGLALRRGLRRDRHLRRAHRAELRGVLRVDLAEHPRLPGSSTASGSGRPPPARPGRGPATRPPATTARPASARRTAWRRSSRWPRPRS